MPGLESLIRQDTRLSPFQNRGISIARDPIKRLSDVYATTQSPEFISKRLTADILTGKKKVGDLDPAVRKLLGLTETKEQMLMKRYLEGDRDAETLEGLGMRVTKTLKEQALEAITTGETLPGMTDAETKKAAGVYIDPSTGKITSTDVKTLGELSLARDPENWKEKLAEVLTPWAIPREAARKKYKGVSKEILEAYKEQFKGKFKGTASKTQYSKGDKVMYQGREYTVAGYSAAGKLMLEE